MLSRIVVHFLQFINKLAVVLQRLAGVDELGLDVEPQLLQPVLNLAPLALVLGARQPFKDRSG